MSHIKVVTGGAWDFHEPIATFVKCSSRGLIGADRSLLEKRAGTSLLAQLDHIKTAADEPLIHLLAIGATEDYGANRNGDGFRRAVCQHYHPTFVKHARFYRDHKNKDPSKSFGIVKASAYNDAMKRIELLVALNGSDAAAKRNGGLLADRELEKLASGKDIPVSMACRVPFDVCSWCGNKAPSREEYCDSPENGGHCKAGGLKNNIGVFVEMEKDGQMVLHHLHADNPNPTFFDISHVFRPADRIAYVTGQLEKAAGMRKLSGTQLAEVMGVTIPYALLLEGEQYSGDVQQMLKLAYRLSDMEQEVASGHFDLRYLPALGPTFRRSLGDLPQFFQEKFASAMRAMADARVCLPLANFIEVTAGYPLEKAAETAEIVALSLPGIYTRMLEQPGFADRIARSPYAPATAAGPAFRVWAEKRAKDYSLAEPHLKARLTLAAIRGTDNLTVRQGAHEKIAVERGASDRLAEEYALYKLAFLSAVPETEPDFQLTASMVLLQNYA